MEPIDIAALTLPKLKQLQARIAKELELRTRASKADVLKQMEKMLKDAGLTLQDVLPAATANADKTTDVVKQKPGRKPGKKSIAVIKEKLPAKYCHPSNRELCWSGRGRRPAWYESWIAGGGSTIALENAAERYAGSSAAMPENAVAEARNLDVETETE